MNDTRQIELQIPSLDWDEKRMDALSDEYFTDNGRDVEAIQLGSLIATQDFLYASAVEFYTAALRSGMFPPPCEGLELPSGQIAVMEGHHRLHAYHKCGFPIPMRVQKRSL